MKTIALNLPESIAELYPKVGEKVFRMALRESVARLIKEERTNLKKIRRRIKVFEKRYKLDFVEFQKNLPVGNFQLHEDYGEWSYLVDVANEIENDIAKFEHLNGKVA
jgi:hypothetical protein